MKNLNEAMTDKHLSVYEKTVFAYFWGISNENTTCSKRRSEIIQELHICPKTFDKSIKKLEYYRYLRVYRQIFHKNVYVLQQECPKNATTQIVEPTLKNREFPVWKHIKNKNNDESTEFPAWNPQKN